MRTLRSPRGLRAASRAGPGLPAPRFVENPASEMLISARFWNRRGANGTACSGLSRSPGPARGEAASPRSEAAAGEEKPARNGPNGAAGSRSRGADFEACRGGDGRDPVLAALLPFGIISPDVRNFPGQGAASGAGFWIPYPPGPAWVMGRRFKGRLCSGRRGIEVISEARLASPSCSPRSLSPVRSRGPGRPLSLLKRRNSSPGPSPPLAATSSC